jgi:hypothetical protein
MVYDHLSGCLILEDPYLGFSELFQIVVVVVVVPHGDIPRLVVSVLGVSKLLAMAKDNGGLCLIIVSKMYF